MFRLDPVNVWAFKVLARTAIVPADGGDDPSFATNPSGTGPWRLFGWVRDDRLVLRRFEDHSETERGHIDETELCLVQEWIEGWGAHPNASPSFQDLHKLVMNR